MISNNVRPNELSSDEIHSIQLQLQNAGCDPGPIDGAWGPRTATAYNNFLTRTRSHIAIPSADERIIGSTSYPALKPEYERRFANCKVSDRRRYEVQKLVDHILANRPRYDAAGKPLGTPWWIIGALHAMESGLNFHTHLHNGDPLTQRTVQVPSGRPKEGNPPFAWEHSATDALKMHGFHVWRDWSVAGALYKAEQYNGWGVRRFHASSGPTAYLWSYTNIYRGGKYVRDGVWSTTAQSQQPGVAAMLRVLVDRGLVTK
jgi:lysozyme family protein